VIDGKSVNSAADERQEINVDLSYGLGKGGRGLRQM